MRYFVKLFTALIIVFLSACSGVSTAASHKGVDADDEVLLATLASLAKRGASAVCDPVVLERELGIKLGQPEIESSIYFDGTPREYQLTRSIVWASTGKVFEFAGYRRSSGGMTGSCQVWIRFSFNRFCDVSSARVQKIMGMQLAITPYIPHRTDFPYVYKFESTTGEKSEIELGLSSTRCANQFELTTTDKWK
jgi:hypothetical protein